MTICVLCYQNAHTEGNHKLLLNKVSPYSGNICMHHKRYEDWNVMKETWNYIHKHLHMYICSNGTAGMDVSWLNQHFDFNYAKRIG